MSVNTVKKRRAEIIGWDYSPYRMGNLIQGILETWQSNDLGKTRIQVYDNNSV
jgi:hypothetical protein